MTPAALALARDGDSAATAAAVTLWKSIVGAPDADPAIEAAFDAADWGQRESLDVAAFALGFDFLYASDVVGRTQAFGRMVQGGMDAGKAAGLSGLVGGE